MIWYNRFNVNAIVNGVEEVEMYIYLFIYLLKTELRISDF